MRKVDTPTPPEIQEMYAFAGEEAPDSVPMDFDFGILKELPFLLKLDVGASSYYSEIASMQTLDNMLMAGLISPVQYLERVPDSYVPAKTALIAELRQKEQEAAMMQQMMAGMPPAEEQQIPEEMQPEMEEGQPMAAQLDQDPEITAGRGYRAAARAVNGGA